MTADSIFVTVRIAALTLGCLLPSIEEDNPQMNANTRSCKPLDMDKEKASFSIRPIITWKGRKGLVL